MIAIKSRSMKNLFLILVLFAIRNWAHRYAAQELDPARDPQDESRSKGVYNGELNSECETHFTVELVSLAGEWESYVHYASEDGTAVLLDDNCTKVTWFERDTESDAVQIQYALTVSTDESITIGHQIGKHEDFFGVLIVTMTQKPSNDELLLYKKTNSASENRIKQSSPPPKMCVFYIGASSPAHPVLYAQGFLNANCTLENDILRRQTTVIAN